MGQAPIKSSYVGLLHTRSSTASSATAEADRVVDRRARQGGPEVRGTALGNPFGLADHDSETWNREGQNDSVRGDDLESGAPAWRSAASAQSIQEDRASGRSEGNGDSRYPHRRRAAGIEGAGSWTSAGLARLQPREAAVDRRNRSVRPSVAIAGRSRDSVGDARRPVAVSRENRGGRQAPSAERRIQELGGDGSEVSRRGVGGDEGQGRSGCMKWLMALAITGISCFAQPAEVRRWADHWAGEYGVERELIYAVIEAESGGDSRAISSAGAAGVMQRSEERRV